jgi:uncharacterized membrane protein
MRNYPSERNAGQSGFLGRWSGPLTALVILIHLMLTVTLASRLNLGLDETYSMETTSRNVSYAWNQALSFELQPPVWFALLSLWRTFNHSIFFARLFSVLCTVLMLLALSGVARRYLRNIPPVLIVAASAFHPLVIWAAVEIRLYAFVLLLTAVLLILFYDGWIKSAAFEPRAVERILFVLLALTGVYTQYYVGFLLAGCGLALLMRVQWRETRNYAGWMIVVALGIIPLLRLLRHQLSGHRQTSQAAHSWAGDLRVISWRLQELLLPAEWSPLSTLGKFLLALIVALILVTAFQRFHALLVTERVALVAITATVGIFFLVAVRATGPGLMERRHFAVLLPPLMLLMFSLAETIGGRKGAMTWCLTGLIFFVSSLGATYKPMAKAGDWKRVASSIQAAEKDQQPIAVYFVNGAFALRHYYNGKNLVIQLPQEPSFVRYDTHEHGFRDKQQMADIIGKLPKERGEIWLVTLTDKNCDSLGVPLHCQLLEEYLAENFIFQSDAMFTGSRVRLLRRR